MTKIGADSLTDVTYGQVADPTKFHLPCADRSAGGDGQPRDLTFEQLYYSMAYRILTATAHGLVAGDYGKPLSGLVVYDDVDSTHDFSHVLIEAVGANAIRVAPPGADVTIDVDLLQGGAAYDPSPSVSGRFVWWDKSLLLYVPAWPYDTSSTAREVLEIFTVGGSTFTARVL